MKCLYTVCTAFIFLSASLNAQNVDSINTLPAQQEEVKYPQLQFKGLFQGRFLKSLDSDVDVDGLHHSDHSGTDNTFMLKYMRAQVLARVSRHTEVAVLVNLADFKNDPKNKVLENAYVKYTFSKSLAVTAGQFRPWFGIEETYPVDILRTFDFSNQYNEFGKLGWTSFQLGLSLTGDIKLGKMPMQYAVSVVNGNGKNPVSDNDNGKLYSTRLVFGISPKNKVNLGLNAGVGEAQKHTVHAYGADLTGLIKFSDKWNLDLQAEVKQATNHTLFYSLAEAARAGSLNDYLIWGTYVLPALRYEISDQSHSISAVEFTCRYEYLDRNYKIASNPQQIITPMLGLEFLKNYGARIQIGTQISRYRKQTDDTTEHNSDLLVTQLQVRF